MRIERAWLAWSWLMVAAALGVAQENQPAPGEGKQESYELTIIEARVKRTIDLDSTELANSLEQLRQTGDVEYTETVRMSLTENQRTVVQFGRTISVKVGEQVTPRGTMKQTVDRNIGTLVQATAARRGDKLAVEIKYEASRLSAQGEGDDRPEIQNIQLSTTAALDAGRARLLSASIDQGSTLIIARITLASGR